MVAAAGGTRVASARIAAAAAGWIAISTLFIAVLYQRVMIVNRVPSPKPPAALQDRAAEALARLGYTDTPAATAWGMGLSLDYARFIERTSTAPDRWDALDTARPETLFLWYRTSPRPLVPTGQTNGVTAMNPPLTASGMTLSVVDASGRLSEFLAVPPPFETETPAASPTRWDVLFEAAGLPMEAFTSVTPRVVPPVHASERRAWEGSLPQQPDQVFRVEAAAFAGRPVYFAITGPWTVSARSAPRAASGFAAFTGSIEALMMPMLMLAGVVLARRNLRLGRGDRGGAVRAAGAVFVAAMIGWLLRPHVMPLGFEVSRMFAAIGGALFDAGVLWVTYLGLEPYVRRHAPDSLIGWTRLVAGNWRDPRVGYDVMFGVATGLAMTVFYAIHNVVPPLFGRPEPMPMTIGDASMLRGTRDVLAYLFTRIGTGIQGGMLCVVGVVALRMLLPRAWLATLAAIVIFTPVAIAGMFPDGTPILDLVMGALLIAVFVHAIVRIGLLAAVAALTTHFVLLRAPITLEFSSWRGPIGLWFLAVVLAAGLGACYIARHGKKGT
jgi:serine/threonine-protein kinase